MQFHVTMLNKLYPVSTPFPSIFSRQEGTLEADGLRSVCHVGGLKMVGIQPTVGQITEFSRVLQAESGISQRYLCTTLRLIRSNLTPHSRLDDARL